MLKKLVLLLSISYSFTPTLIGCASSNKMDTSKVSTTTTLPNQNTSNTSESTAAKSSISTQTPVKSSAAPASNPPLTVEKLKNAEYFFLAKGPIKLKNGEYKDEATQRIYTLSDVVAYGDINQDKVKDAVTALKVTIPNIGTFSYLVALVNDAGTPKNISTEFMGPEIKVKTLKVNSDNSIQASLGQYQPNDPECCPSVEIERTYKLRTEQSQSSNKGQPQK